MLATDFSAAAMAVCRRGAPSDPSLCIRDFRAPGADIAAAAAVSANRLAETVTLLQDEAQARLAGPAARLEHAGVTTTTEVRRGVSAFTIVALAQPGALIVMTGHGRTGLGRWFLGSVAEAVVRQATAPVLLVRAAPAPPDRPASGSAA